MTQQQFDYLLKYIQNVDEALQKLIAKSNGEWE